MRGRQKEGAITRIKRCGEGARRQRVWTRLETQAGLKSECMKRDGWSGRVYGEIKGEKESASSGVGGSILENKLGTFTKAG